MFVKFGLNTLRKLFNMKPAQLHPITFKRISDCFLPKSEFEYYSYLGYVDFLYRQGTIEYEIIKDLVQFIDSKAKPIWCPRFILRLLHLYGNDSSIVRCRSQIVSRWHRRLLGGIFITDIKTKWDSHDVRVYGTFTNEINKKIYKAVDELDKLRPK